MSSHETDVDILSNLDSEKRIAIAARIITLWTMSDIGAYLRANNIVFAASDSPNTSAKHMMFAAAESEFRQIRISCLEVTPDSNAHIARQQMGFTTKTINTKLGNKKVHTLPELQVATYYLEDDDIAAKIDSSLSITPVLDSDGQEFRNHYAAKAIEHIEVLGDNVDLRQLVYDTTNDSEYWLEH